MSDNVPSIQLLIDKWSDRYGKRFPTSIRTTALDELIRECALYGYERGQIERSKAKVIDVMVGPRSPFGSSALKEWKIQTIKDFDKAMRAVFEQFEERTGTADIPFTLKELTPEEELEIERQELEDLRELNSLKPDVKQEYGSDTQSNETPYKSKHEKPDYSNDKPVIRPELPSNVRENVTVSPIMSDQEFLDILERYKDE